MTTTLGLDAARALDPERFRVGGAIPRAALRPASREELSEALRAAAREQLSVIPWGGGVALANPADDAALPHYDLALELPGLDRVIEYDPEDFTLTAECGATIATLRALLGSRAAGTAARGRFRRTRHPRRRPRRQRLGTQAAALRLAARPHSRRPFRPLGRHPRPLRRQGGEERRRLRHPSPALRLAWRVGADRRDQSQAGTGAGEARGPRLRRFGRGLAEEKRWERFPRLEPALLSVVGSVSAAALPIPKSGAAFAVVVGLEDDALWVEQQVATTIDALGSPALRIEGDEAAALWQALADLEEQDGARLSFTTARNTPAALESLLDRTAARMVFHAPAGRLHRFPEADHAEELLHLAVGAGFTLIDRRGVRELEPVLAAQAVIAPLRSRIREALDPRHLLALGDRWING